MTTKKAPRLAHDDERSLHKRYLFWLYKTTKEELDKIERKFTQLTLDRQIQASLVKKAAGLEPGARQALAQRLKEWEEYVAAKESDARKMKFNADGSLNADHCFLHLKLEAVSEVTRRRLGRGALKEFKQLYERNALARILEDTSGKR